MHHPGAAERIKATIPDVGLIAILRHPVERAYSAYQQLIRDGSEPSSIMEALDQEEERLNNNWHPYYGYQRLGFYYENIKHGSDEVKQPRDEAKVMTSSIDASRNFVRV